MKEAIHCLTSNGTLECFASQGAGAKVRFFRTIFKTRMPTMIKTFLLNYYYIADMQLGWSSKAYKHQ